VKIGERNGSNHADSLIDNADRAVVAQKKDSQPNSASMDVSTADALECAAKMANRVYDVAR
jgi:hypothetical protein